MRVYIFIQKGLSNHRNYLLALRLNFIKLSLWILLVIFAGCNDNGFNEKWISDFAILKQEMSNGYANLYEASIKENIDLIELNEKTIYKLRLSKSKSEAQDIIINFLEKFNDGHLRANRISDESKVKNINSKKESRPQSIEDSIITELKALGYTKKEMTSNVRFDSIKGYRELNLSKNPFKTGIISSPKGDIGILKLHFFGYWMYWSTAKDLWEIYRKEYENGCDQQCEWEFMLKVEEVLTQKVIESIQQLNQEKITLLLIDVTGNGGGTEWGEKLARLFTDRKLMESKKFFVKHNHWKSIFENYVGYIDFDLANPVIKEALKSELIKLKEQILMMSSTIENRCKVEPFVKGVDTLCPMVHEQYFASELPKSIMQDHQFDILKTKSILETARFLPFQRGIYTGPLYILQDQNSASATEGFTSILQLNDIASVVGEISYGAGCGYTNGGLSVKLSNLDLIIKMPDCIRCRKDGKNEIYGILPDIKVNWIEGENSFLKGKRVIKSIINSQS